MPSKSDNKPSNFKKSTLLIPAIVFTFLFIIIMIVILVFVLLSNNIQYQSARKADLERLSTAEYNSIFCSLYSIENFSEEDFLTYRGFNTLKLENTLRDTADLNEYLETAFASGNPIENIYLGLDPVQMWSSSRKNADRWNTSVSEDILSHASDHPEVTFEILLPAPSLEYWTELDGNQLDETLTLYQTLISDLSSCSNIMTYFMGGEHWLIANPANYTDIQTTNAIISQKMMLFTFCDHKFQANAENASAMLDALRELVVTEKTSPTEYPDLSAWDVVFFGDSIIGNYEGSFSVPGVTTGLSNAKAYNCAQGGIPACVDPDCVLSFPSSVDFFMAQNASTIPGDGPFRATMAEYLQEEHSGRKLCFVLNFGLNDYFGGHPVDNAENPYDTATYAGALREGISRLQSAYPDALILLMTPTFTVYFNNGTELLTEEGGVLTEYVDAALQVAEETNVLCLNNYTGLGIDESTADTYLADGCHLNETGRFLLAEHIIAKIAAAQSGVNESPSNTSVR